MLNKKLAELEESEGYVFHGSPFPDIRSLEPRQGKHVPDLSKPTETILDGKPAVSATPYLELAIFRAIINNENVQFNHTSGFGINNGKKEFRLSSIEVLEEVKDKGGFVYVFNKKDFEPYSRDNKARGDSMEWRSYKKVIPIDVIEVSFDDLPSKSKITFTE